jgi:hypothetical protein
MRRVSGIGASFGKIKKINPPSREIRLPNPKLIAMLLPNREGKKDRLRAT